MAGVTLSRELSKLSLRDAKTLLLGTPTPSPDKRTAAASSSANGEPGLGLEALRDRYLNLEKNEKMQRLRELKARQQTLRDQKQEEENRMFTKLKEMQDQKEAELRQRLVREATQQAVKGADTERVAQLETDKRRQLQLMEDERNLLRAQEDEARRHIELLTQRVVELHSPHLASSAPASRPGRASDPDSAKQQRLSRASTSVEDRTALAREQGRRLGEIAAKTRQLESTRDKIMERLSILSGRTESRSGLLEHASSTLDVLGDEKPTDLRKRLQSAVRRDEEARRRFSAEARRLKPASAGSSRALLSRQLGDKYKDALTEMDAIVELGGRAMQQQQQQRRDSVSRSASTPGTGVEPQRLSRTNLYDADSRRTSRPSTNHSRRPRPVSRSTTIVEDVAPLIDEVAKMRQQYLARGGNDPAILRQMSIMEAEALDMTGKAAQAAGIPSVPLGGPIGQQQQLYMDALYPQLLRVELENQMLQQEIKAMSRALPGYGSFPAAGHAAGHAAYAPPPQHPAQPPHGAPRASYAAAAPTPFQLSPSKAPQPDPRVAEQQAHEQHAHEQRLAEMKREAEVLAQEAELQKLRRSLQIQDAQENSALQAELNRLSASSGTDPVTGVAGSPGAIAAATGATAATARRESNQAGPAAAAATRVIPQRIVRTPLEQDHDIIAPGPFEISEGFVVYFDFATGLPPRLSHCSLVYGLFEFGKARSDSQSVDVCETVQDPYSDASDRTHACPFPQDTEFCVMDCPPRPGLHLIVELHDNGNGSAQPVPFGWTKLYLFDEKGQLACGRWRLKLRRPPVNLHSLSTEMAQLSLSGHAELCVRVVDGRYKERHDALDVECNRHYYLHNGLIGADVVAAKKREAAAAAKQRGSVAAVPGHRKGSVPPPPDQPPPPVGAGVVHAPLRRTVPRIMPGRRQSVGQASTGSEEGEFASSSEDNEDLINLGLRIRRAIDIPHQAGSELFLRAFVEGGGENGSTDEGHAWLSKAGRHDAKGVDFASQVVIEDVELNPGARVVFQLLRKHSNDAGLAIVGWSTSDLFLHGHDEINLGVKSLPVFRPPVNPDLPSRQRDSIGGARLNATIFIEGGGDEGQSPMPMPPGTPFSSAPQSRRSTALSYAPSTVQPTFLQPSPSRHSMMSNQSRRSTMRAPAYRPPTAAWRHVARREIPSEVYEDHDGFDLYIDGARFLPYNVTISKVVGRVFSADYQKQGQDISTSIELDSDIYNPEYLYRMECRGGSFTPTSTILLKIYTIDIHTGELCVVGYSALNLFLEAGSTKQPTSDDAEGEIVLNSGAHQLRLFQHGPETGNPLSSTCMRKQPLVPCTSLLVRILPSPKDQSGEPFSVADVPEEEWMGMGLLVPAPLYQDGEYMTNWSPTRDEGTIMEALLSRKIRTVRDSIAMIGDGKEKRLKTDKARKHWIRSRLTRATGMNPPDMAITNVVKYNPAVGFCVAVDRADNLAKPKLSHACFSLTPPGAFYHGTEDPTLHFTKTFDIELDSCAMKAPKWKDSYTSYKRRVFQKNTALIVDVRGLDSKGPTLMKQGWTILPVFTEDGFVAGGRFQLPLYQGEPPKQLFDMVAELGVTVSLQTLLKERAIKLVDSASVTVRLCDARRTTELSVRSPVDDTLLPKDKKYRMLTKSKHIRSQLPRGTEWALFQSQIRDTFAHLLGKQ